jgi:hypothetical protein
MTIARRSRTCIARASCDPDYQRLSSVYSSSGHHPHCGKNEPNLLRPVIDSKAGFGQRAWPLHWEHRRTAPMPALPGFLSFKVVRQASNTTKCVALPASDLSLRMIRVAASHLAPALRCRDFPTSACSCRTRGSQ